MKKQTFSPLEIQCSVDANFNRENSISLKAAVVIGICKENEFTDKAIDQALDKTIATNDAWLAHERLKNTADFHRKKSISNNTMRYNHYFNNL